MADIVDRLNPATCDPTLAGMLKAMGDGAEAIMELRRERSALQHRGYLLAMELLQSDLWAKLDGEAKAAAESFLPRSLRIDPPYTLVGQGNGGGPENG